MLYISENGKIMTMDPIHSNAKTEGHIALETMYKQDFISVPDIIAPAIRLLNYKGFTVKKVIPGEVSFHIEEDGFKNMIFSIPKVIFKDSVDLSRLKLFNWSIDSNRIMKYVGPVRDFSTSTEFYRFYLDVLIDLHDQIDRI